MQATPHAVCGRPQETADRDHDLIGVGMTGVWNTVMDDSEPIDQSTPWLASDEACYVTSHTLGGGCRQQPVLSGQTARHPESRAWSGARAGGV